MAEPWKAADHGEDSLIERELVTGEAVALDVRSASVILRGAGTMIDWVAYVGFFLLMALVVSVLFGDGIDEALAQALAIAGLVFSLLIVPMLVETLSHGRSLGRWAVGARIVRDDGGGIAMRHAFIRALSGVVELLFTVGGLAAIVGLLNRRSKRIGDLLAGTVSQQERVPRPQSNAVGVPEALVEWSKVADVARLPDPLARRIAAFLAQAPKMAPASRERLAASLAAETAPSVAPWVDTSPELLLAAVAAIRRERELTALRLEQRRFDDLAATLSATPNGFPDR